LTCCQSHATIFLGVEPKINRRAGLAALSYFLLTQ
jgi:hypothetical protein